MIKLLKNECFLTLIIWRDVNESIDKYFKFDIRNFYDI